MSDCTEYRRVAILHRRRFIKALIALVIIAASGFVYTRSAITTYQASDAVAPMEQYEALKPYLELNSGRYLLGGLTADDLIYEDQVPVPWFRLVDDLYIKYPIPGRGGDSMASHGYRMLLTETALHVSRRYSWLPCGDPRSLVRPYLYDWRALRALGPGDREHCLAYARLCSAMAVAWSAYLDVCDGLCAKAAIE
jgi:hypothetical protein